MLNKAEDTYWRRQVDSIHPKTLANCFVVLSLLVVKENVQILKADLKAQNGICQAATTKMVLIITK